MSWAWHHLVRLARETTDGLKSGTRWLADRAPETAVLLACTAMIWMFVALIRNLGRS